MWAIYNITSIIASPPVHNIFLDILLQGFQWMEKEFISLPKNTQIGGILPNLFKTSGQTYLFFN